MLFILFINFKIINNYLNIRYYQENDETLNILFDLMKTLQIIKNEENLYEQFQVFSFIFLVIKNYH